MKWLIDNIENFNFLIRKLEKIDNFIFSVKVFEAHRELCGFIASLKNSEKDFAGDKNLVQLISRKLTKVDNFVLNMKVFEARREINSLTAILRKCKEQLIETLDDNKNKEVDRKDNEE
jgi:flagellar biosynthesis regulator FlbT